MAGKLDIALSWIVSILRKHDIPFQLSGGFAAHQYGATRPVNDIDIDLPEDKIDVLLPDIGPYIVFSPGRYRDEKWDLLLVTLDYYGQEIDLGGAYDTKIFDKATGEWIRFPARLDAARMMRVFGIEVPVVAPDDLIAYKRLLDGEHQRSDAAAISAFLAKEGES